MDKAELLALFTKADTKHGDLVETITALTNKFNNATTDTTELKATIADLVTQCKTFADMSTELKNEIADLELKGSTPAFAISLKDQNVQLVGAVKKGLGNFMRAKARDKAGEPLGLGAFKDFISTEVKALNLTTTAEGLESVDEILSREVIQRAREAFPIIGAVRIRNMPRELREEVLISYPGVQQGIENVAGTTIPQTGTQTYAEVKNQIAKINAKPRITDEAMLGSDLDLYGQLLTLLDEEIGRWLALQILFGSGASKAMRGILSSNRVDITNVTGESFKVTINSADPSLARDPDFYPVFSTGVSGGLPATSETAVNYFIDMKKQLPTKYLGSAKWRFNRNTLAIIEKLRDNDGAPIFRDNYQDGDSRILGHGYELDDDMPDFAADSTPIIFGDVSQAFSMSSGDIDKMLLDPYTVDGCTVVKIDKEFFEIVGKNDAIVICAATTNDG